MAKGHKPRFFSPEELVPKLIFTMLKERSLILIDSRILITIDRLRERYGKFFINDWSFEGGTREQCGWRPSDSKTGEMFSQHRFGRAVDMHPQAVDVAEIHHDLRKLPDRPCYEYITAVEDNVPWLHIDVRNNSTGKIIWFSPKVKEDKTDPKKEVVLNGILTAITSNTPKN
jgi:hypothetical protein